MNDFLFKVVEQEFENKIIINKCRQLWENNGMSEYMLEFNYLDIQLFKNVLIQTNRHTKDQVINDIKIEIEQFQNASKQESFLNTVAYIYNNIRKKYARQLNDIKIDVRLQYKYLIQYVELIKARGEASFKEIYKEALEGYIEYIEQIQGQ